MFPLSSSHKVTNPRLVLSSTNARIQEVDHVVGVFVVAVADGVVSFTKMEDAVHVHMIIKHSHCCVCGALS